MKHNYYILLIATFFYSIVHASQLLNVNQNHTEFMTGSKRNNQGNTSKHRNKRQDKFRKNKVPNYINRKNSKSVYFTEKAYTDYFNVFSDCIAPVYDYFSSFKENNLPQKTGNILSPKLLVFNLLQELFRQGCYSQVGKGAYALPVGIKNNNIIYLYYEKVITKDEEEKLQYVGLGHKSQIHKVGFTNTIYKLNKKPSNLNIDIDKIYKNFLQDNIITKQGIDFNYKKMFFFNESKREYIKIDENKEGKYFISLLDNRSKEHFTSQQKEKSTKIKNINANLPTGSSKKETGEYNYTSDDGHTVKVTRCLGHSKLPCFALLCDKKPEAFRTRKKRTQSSRYIGRQDQFLMLVKEQESCYVMLKCMNLARCDADLKFRRVKLNFRLASIMAGCLGNKPIENLETKQMLKFLNTKNIEAEKIRSEYQENRKKAKNQSKSHDKFGVSNNNSSYRKMNNNIINHQSYFQQRNHLVSPAPQNTCYYNGGYQGNYFHHNNNNKFINHYRKNRAILTHNNNNNNVPHSQINYSSITPVPIAASQNSIPTMHSMSNISDVSNQLTLNNNDNNSAPEYSQLNYSNVNPGVYSQGNISESDSFLSNHPNNIVSMPNSMLSNSNQSIASDNSNLSSFNNNELNYYLTNKKSSHSVNNNHNNSNLNNSQQILNNQFNNNLYVSNDNQQMSYSQLHYNNNNNSNYNNNYVNYNNNNNNSNYNNNYVNYNNNNNIN